MSAFGPKRTFRGGITRRIAPIKRANVPRHLAARKFPSELPVAKVSASPALMCPLRAGSEIHVPRQMRRLRTHKPPLGPHFAVALMWGHSSICTRAMSL